MVFTSMALLARAPKPDIFWKRRKLFRMTAHFYGRARNVYGFALRNVKRALARVTDGRRERKKDMTELRRTRITAAVEEHGFTYGLFKESLNRSAIHLDSKVLADLAIWEPRSFKALTNVAWAKAAKDKLDGVEELGPAPTNVEIRNLKDS